MLLTRHFLLSTLSIFVLVGCGGAGTSMTEEMQMDDDDPACVTDCDDPVMPAPDMIDLTPVQVSTGYALRSGTSGLVSGVKIDIEYSDEFELASGPIDPDLSTTTALNGQTIVSPTTSSATGQPDGIGNYVLFNYSNDIGFYGPVGLTNLQIINRQLQGTTTYTRLGRDNTVTVTGATIPMTGQYVGVLGYIDESNPSIQGRINGTTSVSVNLEDDTFTGRIFNRRLEPAVGGSTTPLGNIAFSNGTFGDNGTFTADAAATYGVDFESAMKATTSVNGAIDVTGSDTLGVFGTVDISKTYITNQLREYAVREVGIFTATE